MKLTTILSNLPKVFRVVILSVILTPFILQGQTITSDPILPTDATPVLIYFDATGTALEGYTGDLYAHTGVNIEGVGNWQHVIGSWGNNTTQPKLERLSADYYLLEIEPSIRAFYNVPQAQVITGLAFVFRAAAGSPQSADLFVEVFEDGKLIVSIIHPPKDQPIVEYGQHLDIFAAAIASDDITLFINNEVVATTTDSVIEFSFNSTEYGYGTHWFKATATQGSEVAHDSTYVFVRPQPEVEAMPEGLVPGINYLDDNTVTLVLHDPPAMKEYVFVLSDIHDWQVTEEGYMKVTPSGTHFWLTFTDLTPDTEYAFQYFIDNEVRIPDPYAEKILDPWNDQWISDFNYPGLKEYPEGKTNGYVSVMHPGRPVFEWEVTDFTPPAPEDMVIYELLIRDFVETSAIKTVMDSLDYLQNLGVNVIELMPINQFEGNISWGYNPAMYFATDKAYGTREDYKKFIDECHKRGIAVVIDIVLNHSFNMSPLVQMYFDPNAGSWGQPTPENPWYLETCPHEPWCWGNTFDQDSPYTHELFNRITEYWLTEFKVDGFRFDFTKGFTNVQTGGQGWNYDAQRIANLKRIADHVWSVNPDTYVILEHFTDNSEEKELADYGMMSWANHVHHNYQEAAMGWLPSSNFQNISHQTMGWNNPHLVGYMESHDEERMMFKNINYGNSEGSYNTQETQTALRRIELAATFFFTIPGPKMIWQFGELGYDYSINHCQDGTIDDGCRTDPKPIRWDYYDDWRRKRLYDVYAMLIELKKEQDVFRTDDYTLSLNDAAKRIHLNHASNIVTVLGNFGVTETSFNPNFQQTGTWHEFFSGETLVVDDLSDQITLQPGEYRLYSTVAFPAHGVPLNTENQLVDDNTGVSVFPNPSSQGFNFNMNADKNYHVRIVNLQGQTVFEKMNAFGPTQSHFYWNNTLDNGQKAAAGLYFYSVYSAGESFSGKIMIK